MHLLYPVFALKSLYLVPMNSIVHNIAFASGPTPEAAVTLSQTYITLHCKALENKENLNIFSSFHGRFAVFKSLFAVGILLIAKSNQSSIQKESNKFQ